jgi:D-alanyl-D-alanine dipeptidase
LITPVGIRVALVASLAIGAVSCSRPSSTPSAAARPVSSGRAAPLVSSPIPAPAPAKWVGLLGEYGAGADFRVVAEYDGRLRLVDTALRVTPLAERGDDAFVSEPAGVPVRFARDGTGRASALTLGTVRLPRKRIEPESGTNQLRVTPVRPLEQLRAEALAAKPPAEAGPFAPSDLVELVSLVPTIHLEIRYATTNNFLGTKFYDEARAFMQRPAAEALVRAHRSLAPLGYGLLIHDAYRPWYVTKMFWDATPTETRWLVADPALGSRHNRGAAVDLTLYELATSRAVEMPSTYDESTDRAYAEYPGGTSRQRWHRALLRRAMEAQGFRVNPHEWWHFDHESWRRYGIGNVPFSALR